MPKLKEQQSLYKELKRVSDAIRGKRNLRSDDTAAIALRIVLRELDDASMTAEELLKPENAEERARIVIEELKPLMTAAKNVQDNYCAPNELLPATKGTEEKQGAEFA